MTVIRASFLVQDNEVGFVLVEFFYPPGPGENPFVEVSGANERGAVQQLLRTFPNDGHEFKPCATHVYRLVALALLPAATPLKNAKRAACHSSGESRRES